jgi:hypothetical protein
MADRVTGGCLCGAVRYEASGTPYRVGLCHCLDCRKHHGAIFLAFAIFPMAGLMISGETRTFEHPKGTLRHCCAICGAPTHQIEVGSDEAEIYLGSLDAPDRLLPTYELWIGRRESWLPEIALARHYPFNREGKGRTEP